MSSQQSFEVDMPSLKVVVDELQRRLREEEDSGEMEAYRKAFKKLIPLFMRGYMGGYLLQQIASHGRIRRKMTTVSLFLSIGKNRRVFPRDLIQLLFAAAGLSKADIGDIKILDNYSFIEVDERKATEVIHKLDGLQYRGRNLTVNFAKKRSVEETSESENLEEEPVLS